MPYAKKKFYLRGGRRRRQWQKSGAKAGNYAYSAWKGVQYLKGLINVERKVKIESANNQSINGTTGLVVELTNVSQGDGQTTRDGNSIFCRNVFGRHAITRNAAGASVQLVRFMVVKDLQQQGDTNPTVSDILNAADPLSPLSLASRGRFTILRDKLITLTDQYPNHTQKLNVPMKHHVRYNGTAASDIQKGGLYVVMISNTTSNHPVISYNYSTSFYDN